MTKPILLVEDNEKDQLEMKRAFASAVIKNQLIFAAGADEAMRCLAGEKTQPGVILLKAKLREDSGPGLLLWIRERERWNEVPVVLLADSEEERNTDRIERPGADEYLIKPPDTGKMRQLATGLKEKFWSGEPTGNNEYFVFEE